MQVEGDDEHGVDVQFPWEAHPAREHDHAMSMPSFYIDKFPVLAPRERETCWKLSPQCTCICGPFTAVWMYLCSARRETCWKQSL